MISTDCRKCAKSDFCYVDDVKPCIGYEPKKLTNADRIRSMTDEELADELLEWYAVFSAVEWTKDMILDWLRKEAADKDGAE